MEERGFLPDFLPGTDEELRAKFMDCARSAAHVDAAALFERLARLERVAAVSELAGRRILAPGFAPSA